MLDDLRFWWRALVHGKAAEAELDDELQFHLERETEKYARGGLAPAEARRRARIALGGVEQAKEECREARGVAWLEGLWRDSRAGLRMLRRAPGFAATAISILALGIGANAAIFSVVDAAVLRPLPYPDSSQLVNVFESLPGKAAGSQGVALADLEDWNAQSHAFRGLAGVQFHQLTLTGSGEPTVLETTVVTGDFFAVLETKPLLGRTLGPADCRRGAAPAVVLSENLWRSRFGGDPAIAGRAIVLDKRPFTVAGVMPAGFRSPFFPASNAIWIPVAQDPVFRAFLDDRGGGGFPAIGRLRPGIPLAQGQAQLNVIAANLAKEYPATDAGIAARVEPLAEAVAGGEKGALLVLLGAVGLVLLIACANVASLLLARAAARAPEMGIRIALGAGRGRIVRQLLTESAVLGLAGGAGGLLLAYGGVAGLRALAPAGVTALRPIAVDARVLVFALALSLGASLLFGLAPALLAADSSLQERLKTGAGRAGSGGRRHHAHAVLAVAEMALAMMLLAGAGLLLRSFVALTSVNPGFQARQVWAPEVSLPQYEYSAPRQWSAFCGRMLERIQAQPGLGDAALVVPLPLVEQAVDLPFTIAGNPPLPPGAVQDADSVSVSPGYFGLMEIPLLRGRLFTRQDAMGKPRVAIVSRALAERYFANENPLGRHIVFGLPFVGSFSREIVGVVGDVRDAALRDAPRPMMYVPFAQAPFWGAEVLVRTGLKPASVAAGIRAQVREVDPDLPVTDFRALSYAVEETAAQARFRTLLLALFGLVALALAAAGIFGVVSYSVSRRRHELGIRLALGAAPGELRKMVLREGARLAAMGLGLGIAGALGFARYLESQLYGIRAGDPLALAAAAALLAVVALAACSLPARRAMRVDPVVALRQE